MFCVNEAYRKQHIKRIDQTSTTGPINAVIVTCTFYVYLTVSPALLLSRFIDPHVYRRLRIYGLPHTQPTVKYYDFTQLSRNCQINKVLNICVVPKEATCSFLHNYLWSVTTDNILKSYWWLFCPLTNLTNLSSLQNEKNPNITVSIQEYIRMK